MKNLPITKKSISKAVASVSSIAGESPAIKALVKVRALKALFKDALYDGDWKRIKALDEELRGLMEDAVNVVTSSPMKEGVLHVELRDEVKLLIETYTTCIQPKLGVEQEELKDKLRDMNKTRKGLQAYRMTKRCGYSQ